MKKNLLTILLLVISTCSYAVDKVTVVGLFKDKAILTIDGKQRLLATGKTSPEGVKLISANSREAVIEINGEQKTYQLGSHITNTFKEPTGGTTVSIAPDAGGMYLVNGSINDFQVNFLVDTGATLISMNKHHAKRIGLNYKIEGEEGLTSTAAGFAKVYRVKLKKVKVGNIELKDVDASVHDGDFPDIILLGNSFLNRLYMSREGRLMKLEKK